jgi:hypothetical protein
MIYQGKPGYIVPSLEQFITGSILPKAAFARHLYNLFIVNQWIYVSPRKNRDGVPRADFFKAVAAGASPPSPAIPLFSSL